MLVSGLTVMVAMAGMFLTGDATFASLGLATILVVAVAVLGSLTVLPALLSKLGDRVDRLRVPLVGRLAATTAKGGSGAPSSTASCAGPRCRPARGRGCMLALAAPALQLHIATPRAGHVPEVAHRRQDLRPDAAGVPGHGAARRTSSCRAPNVNAPPVRAAIGRLEQRALASGQACTSRSPSTVNKDATVANITVPIAGKGTDAASNASLAALRDVIVPETVGALPNTEAGVTGLDGGVEGPGRRAEVEDAARRRLRARCSRSS